MPMPDKIEKLHEPDTYQVWFGERSVFIRKTAERNYSGLDPEDWFQLYVEALRHLPARPARVIDLGCGSGYGADLLARAGYAVLGIDQSIAATSFARLRAPGAWFITQHMSRLHELDLVPADAVIAIESLEHVADLPRVLSEIWNALNPGGLLFLSTPDKELLCECAGKNVFHPREYTETELETALRFAKFAHFERLKLDWSSEYERATMVLIARRPTEDEYASVVANRPRCGACGELLHLDHVCPAPIRVDHRDQEHVFKVYQRPDGAYLGICETLDATVEAVSAASLRCAIRAWLSTL